MFVYLLPFPNLTTEQFIVILYIHAIRATKKDIKYFSSKKLQFVRVPNITFSSTYTVSNKYNELGII